MMAKRPTPTTEHAAYTAREFKFDDLPMHHVPCSLPVKALTAAGGLVKGNVYVITMVTSNGRVRVRPVASKEAVEKIGGFPLDCFAAPKLSGDNLKVLWNWASNDGLE